jgi:hypothetical protein
MMSANVVRFSISMSIGGDVMNRKRLEGVAIVAAYFRSGRLFRSGGCGSDWRNANMSASSWSDTTLPV